MLLLKKNLFPFAPVVCLILYWRRLANNQSGSGRHCWSLTWNVSLTGISSYSADVIMKPTRPLSNFVELQF